MQSMLQQRITRLKWLSAVLLLSVTVAWVGMMFYLPLYDGETLTSLSIKCALVVALVLIGKVPSRVTSGVRATCLWLAFIIFFFFTQANLEAVDNTTKLVWAVFAVFFVLNLVIDARLSRLTRHSKLYYY